MSANPYQIGVADSDPIDDASVRDESADDAVDAKQPTVEDLQAQIRAKDAEIAAEKRLTSELQARDEVWARRMEQGKSAPKVTKPAPADDPDPLESFDWLTTLTDEKNPEAINKKVAKAVKESAQRLIKQGGYVSREELDQTINNLVQNVTAVSALVDEFPDLKDKGSPLYSEQQKQLERLEADPAYAGVPPSVLPRLAALEAERAVAKSGKQQPARETEEQRLERIERQRGPDGRYAAGGGEPELDRGDLALLKRYGAAYGVDAKALKQSKKDFQVGPRLAAMGGER